MDFFKKNGYHVIKGFLQADDISFFRNEIFKDLKIKDQKKSAGGQHQLIENRNYWKLFTNQKLLNSVRFNLNNDEICFIQHTDIHFNFGSGIFHRDNSNRKFMSSPDWDEKKNIYGIVRVAIYLSSYIESKSSLYIIPGSHKKETNIQRLEIKIFNKIHSFFNRFKIQIPHFLFFSKLKKIKLEEGDLVFFDERVLHAGGNINYKKPKITLFFAYGLKNQHTKNHLNFLNRQNKKLIKTENIYQTNIPADLESELRKKDIYYDNYS